jgi:hypothetical protein
MARRRSATLRTSYATGSRHKGRGPRQVASKGGEWFRFDPFAIARWVFPSKRRGKRRTIRRSR